MSHTRTIDKVKFDEKTVTIHWHEGGAEDGGTPAEKRTIESAAAHLPSFVKALAALAPDVVETCELGLLKPSLVTVRGVSFSHRQDIVGVIFTALYRLDSGAQLLLNSPHRTEQPYGENGDESLCLSKACMRRLHQLEAEAEAYLDGERAQGNLFDQAASETATGANPVPAEGNGEAHAEDERVLPMYPTRRGRKAATTGATT